MCAAHFVQWRGARGCETRLIAPARLSPAEMRAVSKQKEPSQSLTFSLLNWHFCVGGKKLLAAWHHLLFPNLSQPICQNAISMFSIAA